MLELFSGISSVCWLPGLEIFSLLIIKGSVLSPPMDGSEGCRFSVLEIVPSNASVTRFGPVLRESVINKEALQIGQDESRVPSEES